MVAGHICAKINKKFNDAGTEQLMRIIVLMLSFWLFLCATLGELQYAEIDSYALPIISMEYRQSMIMNQEDINIAQNDFPNFYNGIDSYDSLRSAKLLKIDENNWASWYFPSYSLVCLPMKVILQLMDWQQERAFSITNMCLFLFAINIVRLKLKMPTGNKLLLLILLIVNPIPIKYINYCSAEVYIFTFVVISLVYFYNKNFYLAGLFACIASLPNPVGMVWGIIIFVCYFIGLYKENRPFILGRVLSENWLNIMKLALCYCVCLIPYIFNLCAIGLLTPMSSFTSFENTWQRFLMYFFDINLGVASCFPVMLIVFIIVSVISIYKLKYRVWPYFIGFISTIYVISLMQHINSGMMLCSRYLIWSCPIFFFTITVAMENKSWKKILKKATTLSIIVTIFLLTMYMTPERSYVEFNRLSEMILDNLPQLYNPYPATFYSRNCNVDGGYDYEQHTPVIYLNSNSGKIRKILFKGNEEDKNRVKELVKTDNDGMEQLNRMLNSFENDQKMHYINVTSDNFNKKNLEEIGKLKEVCLINGISDQVISGNNELGIIFVDVSLKPNTFYKFKIKLSDAFDSEKNICKTAFVDFYSSDGYDFPEQEQKIEFYNGEHEYCAYVNSGNSELYEKQKNARLVIISKEKLTVSALEVYEMEEIN